MTTWLILALVVVLGAAALWLRPRPRRAAPAGRPLDEDVRFSIARPEVVLPRSTLSLVVFAHRGEPYVDPETGPVDPEALVRRRTTAFFGDEQVRSSSVDAAAPVGRGTRLRVAVSFPGVLADPEWAEFDWRGGVHEIAFRLHIPGSLAGQTVRGQVRIWCGPLLVAEATVALAVRPGETGEPAHMVREDLTRYRRIFPSYAHADTGMVEQFAAVAAALGDRYLQDVVALRSGEVWNDRLTALIDEADVFQLFRSDRSVRSEHCRREWEHALSLNREGFVRPLYWQHPLPEDKARDLPPESLRRLHFARVAELAPPSPPPARRPPSRGSSPDWPAP